MTRTKSILPFLALSGIAFFSLAFSGLLQAELKASAGKQVTQSSAEELGSVPNDLGLGPGDAVAEFSIKTFEGIPASFSSLLEDAPLLVIFYRGGWCPYCNFQIRELAMAYPEFEKRGVTPVLISVDKPGGASEVQKTYEIPFPVLSDPDLRAVSEFNVRVDIDEERYQKMKERGYDLEVWSDKTHHVIAASSAFVVDQAGIVKWAHVSEDISVRPSNSQLLTVIDRLLKSGEI